MNIRFSAYSILLATAILLTGANASFCEAPSLDIIEPTSNLVSRRPIVLVKGTATHATQVQINGQDIPVGADGVLYYRVALSTPNQYHEIHILAQSASGDVVTVSRRVYYWAVAENVAESAPSETAVGTPISPPTVATLSSEESVATQPIPELVILSPAPNFMSRRERILIKGVAKGIRDLRVNEQPLKIDSDSGRFFSVITVTPDIYTTFYFVATAMDGTTLTESRRIFYQAKPTEPELPPPPLIAGPVVEILSPSPNFISRRELILVKGSVQNVRDIWVNGQFLSLDSAGKFYAVIKLTTPYAYNTLDFVALGADGTRYTDSRRVYFEPVEPPVSAQPTPAAPAPTPDMLSGVTRAFTPTVSETITPSTVTTPPSPTPSVIPPVPPAVPSVLITFPVAGYKTQATSVLVQGQISNVSEIWVNGVQVPTHTATTFQNYLPFPANQDQLDIFVVVKNASGQVATSSRTVLREISSPRQPRISFISPANGATTHATKVVVRGTTSNTQKLLINDKPVALAKDGSFSVEQPLPVIGNVPITATAVGLKGLSDSQSIVVTRVTPPAPAPTPADAAASNLDRRLLQTVSMDLANASLTDVLKVLSQKAGINLVADATVQGTVTLQLRDMAIRDAIDVILNSQGLTYRYVGNAILVAQLRSLDTPTNLVTDIVKLNNIQSSIAQSIVGKYLTQPESAEILPQENLIIVRAGAQKAAQIHTMLTQLDAQKIPQVVLEARIVETAANALQNLGFNWPKSVGWGTEYQQTITNGVPSTILTNSTSIVTILNLLQEKGKAKVLAQPRLKAIQQTEAQIFIGDQVPYTEVSIDPTGRLTEIVKYLSLGISLKVNPDINSEQGTIRLKINPEISYIFGFRGKNNDVPWVKTRQVSTSVEVKDGETIVIGGLFNSSDLSTESKLPFIGDLPLLGNLLSGSRSDQNNTELIITITPRIVNVDSIELGNY